MKKNKLQLVQYEGYNFSNSNFVVAFGHVSGTVFSDFNASGTKNNTVPVDEVGMSGVLVNAFNQSGGALTVS